mgnify:CR=1 FL=1
MKYPSPLSPVNVQSIANNIGGSLEGDAGNMGYSSNFGNIQGQNNEMNRRNLLKTIGTGIAGVGIMPIVSSNKKIDKAKIIERFKMIGVTAIEANLPKVFSFQKYIINAGATPKLIMSVKESNSFPTLDVPFINLAILPSRPSIKAAKIIAIIANSNLPSNENLIDVNPMHTPIKVSIFGSNILALFLSATIFKLLLGFSIIYFLASNVSPEIAF